MCFVSFESLANNFILIASVDKFCDNLKSLALKLLNRLCNIFQVPCSDHFNLVINIYEYILW